MNSNYIAALARRHAQIHRDIEVAEKSPRPDTLVIMQMKKVRLAYRDRLKAAITQQRLALAHGRRISLSTEAVRLAPPVQMPSNGGAEPCHS